MASGTRIVAAVLILAVAALWGTVWKIRRKVRSVSQELFHTEDIREGFRQVEQEYASTPKSVSAMTSLYLPKIKKDFPEFQYDEMKVRAENALTSYLLALDRRNAGGLTEGNQELRDKLRMRIEMLKESRQQESYQEIQIHRTEIADYRKCNGRCIITFQSALQYRFVRQDENGKILEGNRELLTQARYNVDLIYVQDREKVEEGERGMGLNCPNCGAPLSSLGSKVCAYCGTPVIELNRYVWNFSNVEKV